MSDGIIVQESVIKGTKIRADTKRMYISRIKTGQVKRTYTTNKHYVTKLTKYKK